MNCNTGTNMSVQPSHVTINTTLLVQSSLAICVQHLLQTLVRLTLSRTAQQKCDCKYRRCTYDTNRVIATAHTSGTHSNHSVVSGQEVPSLQQSLGLADDVTNTRACLGITVQAELHQHAQLFCMPVVRWPP